VITNQAQTADNPTSCTARSYTLTTGSAAGGGGATYLPLVLKEYLPPAAALVNGDFESGPGVGWEEYSSQGWALILSESNLPIAAHGGSWAAWLGGDNDEISIIRQVVTVPPSAPYLTYWHWIDSGDLCGYDFGGVIINDTTIVDVYDLCGSTDTGGWVKHSVNLSAYAGQTVPLQIRAETDVSAVSNLFVDDVSFQSSAAFARDGAPLLELGATVRKGVGGAAAPSGDFLLRP